jgi:hypothetical protein
MESGPSRRRSLLGSVPNIARILRFTLLLSIAVALTVAPYAFLGTVTLADGTTSDSLSQPPCVSAVPDESTDAPVLDATIERLSGDRQIRISYDTSALSDAESDRAFAVGTRGADVTVRNATGFRRDGSRYVWTGDADPAITYTYAASNAPAGVFDANARFEAGENWSLAPLLALSYAPVNYTLRPDGVVPTGAFRADLVYLGNLSTVEEPIGCQQSRIHYPPGVDREMATTVASAFEMTSREYPIGTRAGRVETLLTPWDMGIGGYTIGNFMALNSFGNDSKTAIATHEYIHTRQRNRYAPRMRWLTEAIPSYYMYRLPAQTGRMSTADYVVQLSAFAQRAQWNRPFQPATTPNHYFRGAVTVAALDHRIRTVTDGERTLLDVIDRLNGLDGPITVEQFTTVLVAVGDESLRDWVDRHVVAGEQVAVPFSEDVALPAAAWAVLGTYTRFLSNFPPIALLFVTLWYGVTASLYEGIARLWR